MWPKITFLYWEMKKRKSSELMSDNACFWLNREKPSITCCIFAKAPEFLCLYLDFIMDTFERLFALAASIFILSFLLLVHYNCLPLSFCSTYSLRSFITFPFIGGFIWILYSFLLETSFFRWLLLCFIVFISHPPFLSLILCLLGTLVSSLTS